MAFLPLAWTSRYGNAGHMDIRRLARHIRTVLSEMNYASSRVFALRLSQDLEQSGRAPDTYAEFLLRTSAATVHEPPARCR
jgi:hypothetical protein